MHVVWSGGQPPGLRHPDGHQQVAEVGLLGGPYRRRFGGIHRFEQYLVAGHGLHPVDEVAGLKAMVRSVPSKSASTVSLASPTSWDTTVRSTPPWRIDSRTGVVLSRTSSRTRRRASRQRVLAHVEPVGVLRRDQLAIVGVAPVQESGAHLDRPGRERDVVVPDGQSDLGDRCHRRPRPGPDLPWPAPESGEPLQFGQGPGGNEDLGRVALGRRSRRCPAGPTGTSRWPPGGSRFPPRRSARR